MKYIADLHVHSKNSVATAKNLDLENLCAFARIKGITVIGTGDVTHPGWLSEIKEKLIPDEPGLFRLREDTALPPGVQVPESCPGTVRFILQGEISNIYKKNGKTRKNHSVVLLPDIGSAVRFNARLEKIGNIRSDGRPILGLDAKDLLKILLDISEEAVLIPAHIWTPWFSVLGSKSGFDAVDECFEELSRHIFAVETGLSSDPPMNWRISRLDRMTLVSNSDAHSPSNIGRNANMFDTDLSFSALRAALKEKNPAKCLGTVDMYPQEGKYHYDGHRKCNVCLHPQETMERNGVCPVCGKPLTIGVLSRVEELADRPEGTTPDNAVPHRYIIPLAEILSEMLGAGVGSKKVSAVYKTAIEKLGTELDILLNLPEQVIETAGIPLLPEAVRRMRSGDIRISPGYDGEYGRITLFGSDEKDRIKGQQALFSVRPSEKKKPEKKAAAVVKSEPVSSQVSDALTPYPKKTAGVTDELNDGQRQAVVHEGGHLCIIAGPGAGKTRTLTRRIAYAVTERNIPPDRILAVTFTDKAAREMKDRLLALIRDPAALPPVTTFHGFCYQILKESAPAQSVCKVIDDNDRLMLIAEALRTANLPNRRELKPDALLDRIILAKQRLIGPDEDIRDVAASDHPEALSAVYALYQHLLKKEHLYDYDDLILNGVRLLESDSQVCESCRKRYRYLFVDEFQDINEGQYRIVSALAQGEVCVIGDPDQSVYGFRGADLRFFDRFQAEHPPVTTIYLSQNYRSTETILEASHHVIRNHTVKPEGTRVYSGIDGIKTLTVASLASENAEAVAIGKMIERMVGGVGFHSVDFGSIDESGIQTDRSFGDFAILFRTNAQSRTLRDILEKAGIPCQTASKTDLYGRKGIAELLSYLKLIDGAAIISDLKRAAKHSGVSDSACRSFINGYLQSDASLNDMLANPRIILEITAGPGTYAEFSAFSETIRRYREPFCSKPADEMLMMILEQTGIHKDIAGDKKSEEALHKLLSAAGSSGNAGAFLKTLAFESDPDTTDIRAEKVTLMTMHSSKGLEFPVVFIAGCENGYIPYRRSENHEPDEAEERRLLYVAMTRAKERLILTYAGKRTVFGKTTERELSPFVRDIERRLIQVEKQKRYDKTEAPHAQMTLFRDPS